MLNIKQTIAKNFNLAAKSYDYAAIMQKTAGDKLYNMFANELCENASVLDLGSGTGYMVDKLWHSKAKQIVALDLAERSLQVSRGKQRPLAAKYIAADFEYLPFKNNSFDCVVSNLALQWSLNLTQTFAELSRVLKPNGLLLFSTLGDETFKELEQLTPPIPRNPFYTLDEYKKSLELFNPNVIRFERETMHYQYSSFLDFIKELKALGATTVRHGQKRLSRGQFPTGNITISYDMIYGFAKKEVVNG